MTNEKNIKFSILPLIVILFFLTSSCLAPVTKESYLDKFEKFVEHVEQNHTNYNKKDWQWADSQFEKYRKDWYYKFKGEYTLKDQLTIKGLILKYNSLRGNQDFGEILRELFNDDVEDIKEKVQEYIEKDMDEDLDKLIEGAAEIGDSAVKVLEEIIERFDNSF